MTRRLRTWLLALLLSGLALPALAHDVRARAFAGTTVEFHFDDGTPMAFAAVTVTPPTTGETPIETTTDADGRCHFTGDRDGLWRVEAKDADGHVLAISVSLRNGAPAEAAGLGVPDWLVALSLVGNVVLLARLVPAIRGAKKDEPRTTTSPFGGSLG